MKLIRPSYEIIEQGPGLQGIYDIIELCGKISYKSEPKGGEVARRFVEARTKEGHGAVLEFGTVYLRLPYQNPVDFKNIAYDWNVHDAIEFYKNNPHTKPGTNVTGRQDYYYFTTNYRVLVENNRLGDLKYMCEPTEYHQRRYTTKFITDIGLGRDFMRHRVMSPIQESTRYVNYSKAKNGGELTCILPPWIVLPECENFKEYDDDLGARFLASEIENGATVEIPVETRAGVWLSSLLFSEKAYMSLTSEWGPNDVEREPWQAQQARGVLPLATKTELALCGFPDAWIHFFCLRSDIAATGKAHPESEELANPLRNEFIERGYLTADDLKHDTMGMFDVAISDQNLKG